MADPNKEKKVVDLPDNIMGLLLKHAADAGQRQSDGASLYAENLRYDYLIAKSRVDFAQSTGIRHVEESGSGRARMLDAGLGQPVSLK